MKNGEKVWYCLRTSGDNAEVETFAPAVEVTLRQKSAFNNISVTVQPKSGYTDIMAYGESSRNYQRAVLMPYSYWKGVFKVRDRFYLDGEHPNETEEFDGQDANFDVDDVAYQNEAIVLSLKRIKNNN